VAIDDESGVRTVSGENAVNGFAHDVEGRVGERAFRKDGGKSRSSQQHVAFAQRDLQLFGQTQKHVATGQGAACFEEAEVPGRNFGFGGKGELTQTAAATPFAQQIANWPERSHRQSTITWLAVALNS
jgi:hypothetical protein